MKTEGRIVPLELAELHPHPKNPRKPGGGNLAGLAESLRAQGQLEPILVRDLPSGGYEILAGHRRVEGLRLIGKATADAVVRDGVDDSEALAILLAANDQREDVDAFLEALALRELVGFEGSVKGTAARLGQTSRWVAQRLALLELSPTWQKRRKEAPWDAWLPAHWQQIARLAPDAQEALAAEKGHVALDLERDVPAVDDLEAMVNERLRVLGKAPFDVEDGKLCRGTPACSACPKTSKSVPGLFDDGEPTDLKGATCRDAYCWGRKAAATVRAKISAARLKVATGPATEVPVVGRGMSVPKGAGRVLPQYAWTTAKEGSKGAQPVVIVGEGGAVTTGFATLNDRGSPSGSAAKPAPKKAETPAAALARLEADHAVAVRQACEGALWDAVEKLGKVTFRRALALLLLVGAEAFPNGRRNARTILDVRLKLASSLAAGEAFDEEAFVEGIRGSIEGAVPNVSYEFQRAYEQAGGAAMGQRALDVLRVAAGLNHADLTAAGAKVKPSAELVAAREAVRSAGDAKTTPAKKARGKAAAAGDDDAGAADAKAAPAPSGKAKRAGKAAR